MIKRGLAVLALLHCCSYSYCETITSQTPNAASSGLHWTMTTLLPQYTGLTVQAVSYQYTAVKQPADAFEVTVQNYSANGSGYVFRSHDSWTGRPGTTITKTVALDAIPLSSWGRGEISASGTGTVSNPSVLYSYTYDTCKLTPVVDTRCDTYRPNIPSVEDSVSSEYVKQASTVKTLNTSSDEADQKFLRSVEAVPKKRAPSAIGVAQNALLTADAITQAAAFDALNNIPNFSRYSQQIPGGVYQDTLKYVAKALPDSKAGKNLSGAQERLHKTLLESQYQKPELRND